MDWENYLEQNPIQKIENQSEIAASELKITSEEANFCSNTVFSLYFKISEEISGRKTTRFSLQFLFRRDQNHNSNLPSQFKKMCEQIFKRQPPNTIQIL